MAVWLVRAGSHGEYETKFLSDRKVYVTWSGLAVDIGSMHDRSELIAAMNAQYTDAKPKAIMNWASQVWPFAHEMNRGDLVVIPLKKSRTIQIGEIRGDYHFDRSAEDPYYHWREIEWVGESIPRANFGADLLYTFGAFMTICRVKRHSAEERLNIMRSHGWRPETSASVSSSGTSSTPTDRGEEDVGTDLEELARDRIARFIGARFKGHDFTRLIEAILKAEGYTTYRSPEGSDGGADILAGSGPLGFQSPKLCVEVKSGDAPVDRPTVDKLLGAVSKFGADEGLFVSWSGFKMNVQKELAASFFKVRLWDQTEIMERLFLNYDRLYPEIKAELPLTQVWTLVPEDAE